MEDQKPKPHETESFTPDYLRLDNVQVQVLPKFDRAFKYQSGEIRIACQGLLADSRMPLSYIEQETEHSVHSE